MKNIKFALTKEDKDILDRIHKPTEDHIIKDMAFLFLLPSIDSEEDNHINVSCTFAAHTLKNELIYLRSLYKIDRNENLVNYDKILNGTFTFGNSNCDVDIISVLMDDNENVSITDFTNISSDTDMYDIAVFDNGGKPSKYRIENKAILIGLFLFNNHIRKGNITSFTVKLINSWVLNTYVENSRITYENVESAILIEKSKSTRVRHKDNRGMLVFDIQTENNNSYYIVAPYFSKTRVSSRDATDSISRISITYNDCYEMSPSFGQSFIEDGEEEPFYYMISKRVDTRTNITQHLVLRFRMQEFENVLRYIKV